MKYILIIALLIFSGETFSTEKRSVLIFMAADNDLEEYAKRDLLEIEKALSKTNNLEIKIETHLKDRSFRTVITNNQSTSYPIGSLISPGDDLESFLNWGINPQSENILILWGHGQGPMDKNLTRDFGGVFNASENYPALSTLELGDILNKYLIEVLVFDMCLMQNLLVFEHIKKGPRIIIGSAQIQNLIGLPYSHIIEILNKDSDVITLSKEIVQETAKNMPNKNYTFSAFYNGDHQHIFEKLISLNDSLKDFFKRDSYFEFIYSTYYVDLPSFPGNYYDIGMYLGILKKIQHEHQLFPKKIMKKIKKVQDEINFSLIDKKYGVEYISGNRPYYVEYFQGLSLPESLLVLPKM